MRVILVYDINTEDEEGRKILHKVKKVSRRYLHHVQKSVFEGDLTLSRVTALKTELKELIRDGIDSVIIYVFPEGMKVEREILSKVPDPLDNII